MGLLEGERKCINVTGPRKTGKTSFLVQAVVHDLRKYADEITGNILVVYHGATRRAYQNFVEKARELFDATHQPSDERFLNRVQFCSSSSPDQLRYYHNLTIFYYSDEANFVKKSPKFVTNMSDADTVAVVETWFARRDEYGGMSLLSGIPVAIVRTIETPLSSRYSGTWGVE